MAVAAVVARHQWAEAQVGSVPWAIGSTVATGEEEWGSSPVGD